MEWVYLLAMAQEGASVECDFRSGETSVWMFCGLGQEGVYLLAMNFWNLK
jgi:hypothetical protein